MVNWENNEFDGQVSRKRDGWGASSGSDPWNSDPWNTARIDLWTAHDADAAFDDGDRGWDEPEDKSWDATQSTSPLGDSSTTYSGQGQSYGINFGASDWGSTGKIDTWAINDALKQPTPSPTYLPPMPAAQQNTVRPALGSQPYSPSTLGYGTAGQNPAIMSAQADSSPSNEDTTPAPPVPPTNGGGFTPFLFESDPDEHMYKPSSLRNLVLCVILFVFLLGPGLIFANDNLAHVTLPDWLSPEEAKYMLGSADDPDLEQNFTTEEFKTGNLQEMVNNTLIQSVPARASVIATNSLMQRNAVSLSNIVFGFEGIPTNFNFTAVYLPDLEHVVPNAIEESDFIREGYEKWVSTLNRVAEDHPDVNFYYDQLCDVITTKWNPSTHYRSNAITEDYIAENVIAKLSPRFTVVTETIENREDLNELYFTTEHHETLKRALQSYNNCAEMMGLTPADYSGNTQIGAHWVGSTARAGACFDLSSTLYDNSTKDFSQLTCRVNGEESTRGNREAVLAGEGFPNKLSAKYSMYHEYFGYTRCEVIWGNEGPNNGKTLLFIDQSYGVPCEYYLAENYARTIVLSPANRVIFKTLDWYIDGYNVDDVLIQPGMAYLPNIIDINPHIFGRYGQTEPFHLIQQKAQATLFNCSRAHKPQLIPKPLSTAEVLKIPS